MPAEALKTAFARARPVVAFAFIVWHGLALLFGPAPGSYLLGLIYAPFGVYLRTLRLESPWAFFAPNPTWGSSITYTFEGEDGQTHGPFEVPGMHRRLSPAYGRYRQFFYELYASETDRKPRLYADASRYLCQRHSKLHPKSIRFEGVAYTDVPWDHVANGGSPTDEKFRSLDTFDPMDCPQAAHPAEPHPAEPHP